MGKHKKLDTLETISFIHNFGELLKYYVKTEEPIQIGKKSTSYLDITWRNEHTAPFPLFIFEIESTLTKAAIDNVVKVFGRETSSFQKPLFFFHIVQQRKEVERETYLKKAYDMHNYGLYFLNIKKDRKQLMKDIVTQHLQVNKHIALIPVLLFLEKYNALTTNVIFLDIVSNTGYDKKDSANFLLSLERLIANNKDILDYYKKYILKNFSSYNYPEQSYEFITAYHYSTIIHNTMALLIDEEPDYESYFKILKKIEHKNSSFSIWSPHFGLSRDFDWILISEFPLMLTLLCAAFRGSNYSKYFSDKLKLIAAELKVSHRTAHVFSWLLIASQISRDEDSYNFARDKINLYGGININKLISPIVSVNIEESIEEQDESLIKVAPFSAWNKWIKEYIEDLHVFLEIVENDLLLLSIIEGFLNFQDFEYARKLFAKYCLCKTLKNKNRNLF